MSIEIKVPDMGESVIDATISSWIRNEGEQVAAGEPVVELETDKVSLEISAPQAGVLRGIVHKAGETVSVGDTLAYIEAASEESRALASVNAKEPMSRPEPSISQTAPATQTAGNGGSRATPVAQKMAQELGVDLAKVPSTGAGGRVTKEDVQGFVERGKPEVLKMSPVPDTPVVKARPSAPAPAGAPSPLSQIQPAQGAKVLAGERPEERIRMSRRRQTIARRMVEAQQTAAMLTTFNEIDMTAVMDLRKRRREAFKERFGVDLGYMSFFVKASIGALKAFPNVNAEIQGDEIVLKHYYDIGVAIGAEEGLVVPVIHDADKLNFAGIEKAVRGFVEKVKDNTLTLEDLRGGTFTITNGGIYGSLMSTPILNPPQVGILGMHAIKDRPVAVNGQVVIRSMMYVALSYDHRLVDGREAVQFLIRIKELIEDPEALLFG
ncbi:MAG TPA: 2-oxoglutarate dehydrogenase complex dihydrolipoyllysine-residue succinyltransferase [Anaerolineaceae bacterium]|nr:2-oxoglutarate dehydrogenase complex dihydrolipoyllysine-residue succinyltransferase [Anaerolineaceae bacterium]